MMFTNQQSKLLGGGGTSTPAPSLAGVPMGLLLLLTYAA